MFSVIVSEKGGAERRESFDRSEINVGRVQGNDLMLPKGNVSKRHARLLFRDGRFIVTDLKSTNGTYVNGRKIAQATIVREGDKIYIGDFVLRIEVAQAPSLSPEVPAQGPGDLPDAQDAGARAQAAAARLGASPDGPTPLKASSGETIGEVGGEAASPVAAADASAAARGDENDALPVVPGPPRMPSPLMPATPGEGMEGAPEEVTAAPHNSPDRSFPAQTPAFGMPPVPVAVPPAPPTKVPVVDQPSLRTLPPMFDSPRASRLEPAPTPNVGEIQISPQADPGDATNVSPRPAVPPFATTPPSSAPSSPRNDRPSSTAVGQLNVARFLSLSPTATPVRWPTLPAAADEEAANATRLPLDPAVPPVRIGSPGSSEVRRAAYRASLTQILDRVGQHVDFRRLDAHWPLDPDLQLEVDRALANAVVAHPAEGDVQPELLQAAARRELLEYGPITTLLEDDDVTEIQVVRHDGVFAMRGGRYTAAEIPFSSELAVSRVLRRLCAEANAEIGDLPAHIECRLPRGVHGAHLFAVVSGRVDAGHLIVLRKRGRPLLHLDELVRRGTISRGMAGLLSQAVSAHANLLVVGGVGAGATTLLAALVNAGGADERVVVMDRGDDSAIAPAHAVVLPLAGGSDALSAAVSVAARLRPDRLVVDGYDGPIAAACDLASGFEGMIAALRAPTLRLGVDRLVAELAMSKPGTAPEFVRERVASSFDLVVEVARMRDGRHRVLRIAEFLMDAGRLSLRDIFTFLPERRAAGGAIEGTFQPMGVVPAFLEELSARGVSVDPAPFKRHGRSESPTTPR